MKQQGIKIFLIVPASSYDDQATQALSRAGRAVVIDIESIEELPRKLLTYTNY